jgi:glycosyltransferase involved in cell wall biosynthesis
MGAVVPNDADLVSVHHCHAGFRKGTGRLAPDGAPPLRRLNTALDRAIALAAERWCYRRGRTALLAAVSGGVERELSSSFAGIPIALTPNGVDLERFEPHAEVRTLLRREHGVDEQEIIALFVGGNWDLKGLAVAIEGLACARRGTPTVRLWVVGAGDRDRFAVLAAQHGVADRVTFFGPRSDAERFYQAADVFVLPTLYEAFPLVALEAAASGLPLVATAASRVVVEAQVGIVVERTADAVGKAIAQLASDPTLRAQLGDAARRFASQYTWERSVESVLTLYEQLLARSSNGDGRGTP